MVLTPINADQPENADRCAAAGVARVIEPHDLSPLAVRDAVRVVLADPAYKRAAERVQAEMAALPSLEHAVGLLERLAAGRQPIPSASERQRLRTQGAHGGGGSCP
jgi:UDP:flavonoid glycosyltransferase YjiC (YdhE family)